MDIEGKIKVAGIIKESVTDGPGLRYVIFGQGCKHRCEGCQNPHTHDYTKGEWKNIADIYDDICNNPLLDGVTFSGGEPFMQSNKFATLSHMIKDNEKTKHLDIICYSGHVAIYCGGNTIVHASNPSDGIKYTSPANYKSIIAVRRIF